MHLDAGCSTNPVILENPFSYITRSVAGASSNIFFEPLHQLLSMTKFASVSPEAEFILLLADQSNSYCLSFFWVSCEYANNI
jgi:hypothetical protein